MGAYDPVPDRSNPRKDLYDFFVTGTRFGVPQTTEEAMQTYSHSGYVRIMRNGVHKGSYKQVQHKFHDPLTTYVSGEPVHTDDFAEFNPYGPWVPTDDNGSHRQLLPPDFPRRIVNKR